MKNPYGLVFSHAEGSLAALETHSVGYKLQVSIFSILNAVHKYL